MMTFVSQNDPPPLKNLLGAVLSKVAQDTGSARALKPIWAEAVGDTIAAQSWPVALSGKTLLIQVTHPSWANELGRREAELKERLNALLGGDAVQHLQFRVGK
jgi:predicted nucleic acid-binding Zn ribbon protein